MTIHMHIDTTSNSQKHAASLIVHTWILAVTFYTESCGDHKHAWSGNKV